MPPLKEKVKRFLNTQTINLDHERDKEEDVRVFFFGYILVPNDVIRKER